MVDRVAGDCTGERSGDEGGRGELVPVLGVEPVSERRRAGRAIGERISGGVCTPLEEQMDDAGE